MTQPSGVVSPAAASHAAKSLTGSLAGAPGAGPVEVPVTAGFIIRYAIAFIGIYIALMTPVAITLAVRVSAIDAAGKGASLGTILGFGALFALLANPVFGKLSDRTRSRFGRRRPWMVAGMVFGTAAMLVIAFSSSLLVIGIAWCVAQTAYNATLATFVAVVPDQVPEPQRGLVSALMGMALYVAILIGSAIVSLVGTTSAAMFVIPAVLSLLAILYFAFTLKDRDTSKAAAAPSSPLLAELGGMFWVNPLRFPDFGWAWASRFLVFLGMSVLLSYQVYYLTDVLQVAADQIGGIMFLSTLVTTICVIAASFLAGWVSDKIRRRKVFVLIAATVYALGILVIVYSSSLDMFLVGVGVSSIGFGCYLAVDQALVVDVLPNREADAGKNMGVFNIANAVPQSIAPAVAPLLLAVGSTTHGNYALLYAAAALCSFLGALAITPVRGAR